LGVSEDAGATILRLVAVIAELETKGLANFIHREFFCHHYKFIALLTVLVLGILAASQNRSTLYAREFSNKAPISFLDRLKHLIGKFGFRYHGTLCSNFL
jgi:hypothetical protein